MQAFIRFVALGLVRLFYRRIRVTGAEHIPQHGPVVVVSNHVNGLVDPIVMRMAIGRPVAFLAKSTLFANWIARQAMGAFQAIPVYRAKEADTLQNRRTFDMAHALMKNKGWLALFPEGVSHSEPVMQPLKTGAARIALIAEERSDFTLGVQILPVGLSYDAKDTFRSNASATVGPPFTFIDLKAQYAENTRNTAQALTQRIAERLAEVVFQVEDRELWQGFRFVARWMVSADEDATSRQLSDAFRALRTRDPESASALVEETREFATLVSSVGVSDPHALDLKLSVGTALLLVVELPIALLGAALAWLPYRLVDPLSRKLAQGEVDLVSTIKALLGLLVMTVTYSLEACVVGYFFGAAWGLLMLLLAPLTGFIAMRYGERVPVLAHLTRRGVLEDIRKRRDVLLARIRASLLSEI